MVSIDQVFTLLDNGFSRDDIMALVGSGTQAETATQEPAPEPEQKPEPEQNPEPDPADKAPEPAKPEPAQESETDKRLDSIEKSISGLLKTIQSQNLVNDSFGKAGKSLEEQTDDIMATIIRGSTARKEDAI